MRRGIDERVDDLQLLDDRAGPSVRDDDRQRILMLRADMNEMNVQPVDLGDEVRQGVQLRLDLAPVVLRRPIAGELLHRRERHALRCIRDGFLFGPPRRVDAPAQVGELRLGGLDRERPDAGAAGGFAVATGMFLSPSLWFRDGSTDGRASARRTRGVGPHDRRASQLGAIPTTGSLRLSRCG